MEKISITKELKTLGEIHSIVESILDDIPQNILFTISKEELCAYVLNRFDFPVGTINVNNLVSLEQGCKTILTLMGIDDDFEKNLEFGSEHKSKAQLDRFLNYFLDFTDLPGIYKEQLELKVKEDLDKINDYISEYIKIEFINNGETPRNHNQRTQSDFYNRCLEEKLKIENHLMVGIYDRALSKARNDNMFGAIGLFYEVFKDRPYSIPMPKSNEYFDYESIDKVGHRLGEIPISKSKGLRLLYNQNKRQFYIELEKLIPDEQVLNIMQNQISFLPFIAEQRKYIFNELVELYKSKKWFAFYALGLTQIEGLFTEMCRICLPDYNSPYAALPDKVNTVRPYNQFSEKRFDYFQYHLPNLRNRFLHFGIDNSEEIEILCKDLLYDLEKVVTIFSGLNIDANWLLRLVRGKNDVDFMSIDGLCSYFKLLASVKLKKQFIYFESEVKNLNETYLPQTVFNVIYDLDEKIEELLKSIYDVVKVQSNTNGFEVDLQTIDFKDIEKNKTKIIVALKETFSWQFQSEIEYLLEVNYFFKSYKKYLDLNFIADDVIVKIDTIYTKYKDILTRIKLISKIIGFEV